MKNLLQPMGVVKGSVIFNGIDKIALNSPRADSTVCAFFLRAYNLKPFTGVANFYNRQGLLTNYDIF